MEKMLKRLSRPFHYGEKGFTLIELLIVIAVLGILAAVAIPNVSSFLHSGKIAAANSEVATLKTANQGYAADNGGTLWATSAGGLDSYIAGGTAGIKGTYTFNSSTGTLSSATYPGVSNFDTTNQKFY